MTWFGEYPNGIKESVESFFDATMKSHLKERTLEPFPYWSNHIRNWSNGDWKNLKRKWNKSTPWKVLNNGFAIGEIIVANLNTLLSAAGTDYFPDLEDKILLVEDMDAAWSEQERSFRQLQLMGVFEKISGLIIGKPESPKNEGAAFGLNELILEITGKRNYPIVSEFDCSHCVPMHTIAEHSKVSLMANEDSKVIFKILEPFVEE
jgi:muramoyltetrapeptide carboxypeptidase LdcA involved in peptidoglycan recycling